jgi:uncharacterized lipoprotein YmbA
VTIFGKYAPAVLLLLASCGSSPTTNYYALAPVPPMSQPAACRVTGAAPFRFDSVTIPGSIDRLAVVRSAGPNRLNVAEFDRWAAPLDDQLRRVLSDNLAQRLPSGRVIPPQAAIGSDAPRMIEVDIDRFDADLTGHIVLAADWSLVNGKMVTIRKTERIEVDADAIAYDSDVAAMSRALGTLADHIAASIAADGDC